MAAPSTAPPDDTSTSLQIAGTVHPLTTVIEVGPLAGGGDACLPIHTTQR
ncbi:hypothetical protein [Saccharomonospora xinjiangensis]|nr:hypothetical protein [Saccharomonospora xinjiangensis]